MSHPQPGPQAHYPREMTKAELDVIHAVRAMFRETRQRLAPAINLRPEVAFRDPEIRNLQYAQNTLRLCMEACLEEMLPYTDVTCAELGVRLASYAVSAAPVELQGQILSWLLETLPEAHSKRLASGSIIRTEWIFRGLISPNVPRDKSRDGD